MDSINWKKEADRKDWSLYPDDTYLVDIGTWVRGESKKTKSPQIEWTYTMCEDGNPLGGGEIKDYMSLSSAALWRIASLIKASGIDTETLPEMIVGSEEFDRVLNMVKGRKVYIVLITESYDGNARNKVKEFLPYEDQAAAPEYGENQVPDFIKNKVKNAKLT